jgi:hypothetical protein
MDVFFSATAVGAWRRCGGGTDQRLKGPTEVFARLYDASGLSNTKARGQY